MNGIRNHPPQWQRAAASAPTRGVAHLPSPAPARRRWQTVVRASNAEDFASDAQRKFQRFVKEQRLDEKASRASRLAQEKLQGAFEEVSDSAKRTYTKLDSEYDLSSKAARATKQAEESWRDLDQQYSIKRKLRSALAELQRLWPIWSQRASDFSQTTPGKVVGVALFVVALQSGLFFAALNWLLLLWWLSIPITMALGNAIKKKQAEQMQQAEEEYNRRQANPFADFFSQRAGFGGRRAASSGGGAGGTGGGGRWDQDGPVVDAEWISLDDDAPRRRK